MNSSTNRPPAGRRPVTRRSPTRYAWSTRAQGTRRPLSMTADAATQRDDVIPEPPLRSLYRSLCRQHGAEPEKQQPTLDEGREVRIGEAGRAPGHHGGDRELAVGRFTRTDQDPQDEEQERRKTDDALLAKDLEILIVRIAGLEALQARFRHVRTVAVQEPARADAEDRMVLDHSQGGAPHHHTLPQRAAFR